jgi:hypothetical protein
MTQQELDLIDIFRRVTDPHEQEFALRTVRSCAARCRPQVAVLRLVPSNNAPLRGKTDDHVVGGFN